jgi:competence protein ComEC
MKIFKAINENHQNYEIVHNNEEIYNEKDLSMKVFRANIKGKDESNGSSIITLLSYKDFDILFMGDAGVEAFNQVKKDIPHNVEILKVGHHGGPKVVDYDMLNYLKNKASIISTGINYFGHPNKGTLDILRNTDIYRTDMLNAIEIKTNGKTYEMYSYNPSQKRFIKRKTYSTEPI